MEGAQQHGSRLSKYNLGPSASSHGPELVMYIIARLLRVASVYISFKYLTTAAAPASSVVGFFFVCLLVSGIVFLFLQRPWHGRRLAYSQVLPTVLNGGVMAMALFLWGQSLVAGGPVRTILAEYSGAVIGAASTLALGRGGNKAKKLGGLVAMLLAFYCLSQGWAMASLFPFMQKKSSTQQSNEQQAGRPVSLWSMAMSLLAGALLSLRRVIARRVSMKTQSKKRFHSLTVASAAVFLFPFALLQLALSSPEEQQHSAGQTASSSLAYLSTIVCGIVMAFYVDSFAEDRLHVHANTPFHLLVTACSVVMLEVMYQMDFSLVGFAICCSILGFGIFEATSNGITLMKLPSTNTENMRASHEHDDDALTMEEL